MRIDHVLCSEIERLLDGMSVHTYASLRAAYRSALEDYQRTGDRGMADLAREAEKELRKLLFTLRERNFAQAVIPAVG